MKTFIAVAAWAVTATSAAAQDPTPQPVSPETLFRDARAVCDRDQGRLWGRDLCGPMLVVDRESRAVVSNQAGTSGALAADGAVWRGVLPPEVIIANTATDWDGVRWTMVMTPLPSGEAERRSLATHENWHRIQTELGLPMGSPTPAHLATADGRIAMRLEWRALAMALTADSEDSARSAARDALAFRAARRALAGASGAGEERALEMNEGLAEYTAVRLTAADPAAAAARALGGAEAGESYSRSFAYASGPAYGLLLDRFGGDWRKGLTADSDLGVLLAAAVGGPSPGDVAALGGPYGAEAVISAEREEARARAEADARWIARLVDGPILRLPFVSMQIGFDPNIVAPLPPHGTVYPTLTVTDAWGVLKVTGGALIDGNWQGATVPAPAPGQTSGDGWSLDLAPGWRIVPGARAGDYVIRRGE